MRVNKPIAQNKVPPPANKLGGRKPFTEYDELAAKAKALPKGKSLPVVCDNLAEYRKLYQSLRNRTMKQGGFKVQARMGELTIYLSGSGDEEAGAKKNIRTKAIKPGPSKKRTASKKEVAK